MNKSKRITTRTVKKTKSIEGKYEALTIAQYLMSLDPERKYFTNTRMKVSKTSVSAPQIGNVRLNCLLHLCQVFHYLQHKRLLFKDELLAFEQGIIVYSVYSSFTSLYYDTTAATDIKSIDAKTKKFLREWFNHFHQYSSGELLNIVQEDPAWFSTWQKEPDPRIEFTNSGQLDFYQKYFTDFLDHRKLVEKR